MEPLLFHSTNGQAPEVNLKAALMNGQAPDRGLYLPERFPRLDPVRIAAFKGMRYDEIAAEVMGAFAQGVIAPARLAALCRDAYNYDVPLERVYDRVHVMRLDRGPTASFKDFAARMMARLLGQFVREEGRALTILVATSGDTGSAVASAFSGVEGIRVLVLFPVDEVSDRQRKQMTTLAGNIRSIDRGPIDGIEDTGQRAERGLQGRLVFHAIGEQAERGADERARFFEVVGDLMEAGGEFDFLGARHQEAEGDSLGVAVGKFFVGGFGEEKFAPIGGK